jgi:hypothetical protein
MPTLTTEQRAAILTMINQGLAEQAIDRCVEFLNDDLAFSVLERGGHATLQLNPDPHAVPRLRYIDAAEGRTVTGAKIGGVLVFRNQQGRPG